MTLLLEKATPIHEFNTTIKVSGDFYQKNQSDVDRILSEMKQANESGPKDKAKFSALQTSLTNSQELANHFIEQREEAFRLRNEAMNHYVENLLREMKSAIPLQIRLSECIKKELGIEVGTGEAALISERYFSRMEVALKKLTSHLESRQKSD